MSCDDGKDAVDGGMKDPSGCPKGTTPEQNGHCYKCNAHLHNGLCPQCDYCPKCGQQLDNLGLCAVCDPDTGKKTATASKPVAATPSVSGGGKGTSYPSTPASSTKYAPHVDADQINEHVGVGASPQSMAMVEELKKQGYGAILNLQEDFEYKPTKEVAAYIKENFAWASIPTVDSFYGGVPSLGWIDTCVKQMRAWHEQGIKVYVHCKMGKGRSPLIVLAQLTAVEGMDFGKAIALMRKGREAADPNIHQLKQLLAYLMKTRDGEPIDPDPKPAKPFTLEQAASSYSSASSYGGGYSYGSGHQSSGKSSGSSQPTFSTGVPAKSGGKKERPFAHLDPDIFCQDCGTKLNYRGLCPQCDALFLNL